MKSSLALALKVIVLAIVMFVCYAVAGGVVRLPSTSQSPEVARMAAMTLVIVCFINTLVLTHVILRSRWTGWRLMAAIFVVFYGVTTVMSQIETAVFVTTLPPGMLPRLFLMGALVAAPYSVLAVLILGKRRSRTDDAESNTRLIMPAREWTWKLTLIALAYLTLYFTFGYFIAFRNPAVLAYYGEPEPISFVAHMGTLLRDRPWLFGLQVLRAMMWVAIALPVIRMMKGNWPETALTVALLFGVVMNTQLLLPNPYMPESVRLTHMVETASSNVLFGCLVGWLLTQRHDGVRQFRGARPARAA